MALDPASGSHLVPALARLPALIAALGRLASTKPSRERERLVRLFLRLHDVLAEVSRNGSEIVRFLENAAREERASSNDPGLLDSELITVSLGGDEVIQIQNLIAQQKHGIEALKEQLASPEFRHLDLYLSDVAELRAVVDRKSGSLALMLSSFPLVSRNPQRRELDPHEARQILAKRSGFTEETPFYPSDQGMQLIFTREELAQASDRVAVLADANRQLMATIRENFDISETTGRKEY